MSTQERQEYLQRITRRLIIFTGTTLILVAIGLYFGGKIQFTLFNGGDHSYLDLLVFAAGLIGGFVSIQQRLPKFSLEELKTLSGSWLSIMLIPINGGIFALVLMLMFIGHIIQGSLFPSYPDGVTATNAESFRQWLTTTYPGSGPDIAKLLFWSFVAGFSERFVPQIISKTVDEVNTVQQNGNAQQKNTPQAASPSDNSGENESQPPPPKENTPVSKEIESASLPDDSADEEISRKERN